MFQKTGLICLGIGLVLLVVGLFSGWTDLTIIFCLLTPLIFIWTGVILLLIKTKMEKACCWLGFIQGVLWMENVYTIDQIREHNA